MIVLRRRLILWLIKEYVRRWRKTIFLFFILGIAAFFLLRSVFQFFLPKIPLGHKESIGLVGAYTLDTLPFSVLSDISFGLTKIGDDETVLPGAASSWDTKDNGKNYVFNLRKNLSFTDGSGLTADDVMYTFSDVSFRKIDNYTISFSLKEPYTPFLATVSRPFFKKGFIGVGSYKIKNIELNGNFVKSLKLSLRNNQYDIKVYQFYPTEDALKLAYALGEISTAKDLSSASFKDTTFETYPHTKIEKKPNRKKLTTLFYNTEDPVLSDKRLRQSLSYVLPDEFNEGERSQTPFSKYSWSYQKSINEPHFDLAHAQVLFSASNVSSNSAKLTITIKALSKYKKTAEIIKKSWESLGIITRIEQVDGIPSNFQAFLGDYNVPDDPDQYTLWHSKGDNNIAKFKNLRIDKLLVDGRQTTDISLRKKIYSDFIKYILDEAPASFLYFPYQYDLIRE